MTNAWHAGAASEERWRARVEYKSENWDQAGVLANELLPGDPENTTLLRIAADVASRQNKPVDAADLYERALKLEPANKDFIYRLAGLYYNYDELKDWLPRAVGLLTDYSAKGAAGCRGLSAAGECLSVKMGRPGKRQANFKTGFEDSAAGSGRRLSWAYNAYGVLLYGEG